MVVFAIMKMLCAFRFYKEIERFDYQGDQEDDPDYVVNDDYFRAVEADNHVDNENVRRVLVNS